MSIDINLWYSNSMEETKAILEMRNKFDRFVYPDENNIQFHNSFRGVMEYGKCFLLNKNQINILLKYNKFLKETIKNYKYILMEIN